MKAVFFDLDGTLIDSIELIVTCFQHTVRKHLNREIPREDILEEIGKPLRPLLESMSPGNGAELIKTYREVQFGMHDKLVTAFVGMKEIIRDLASYDVRIGIVTSKARPGTDKALELYGEVGQLFNPVITVEDCTEHKPSPAPLLRAAELSGCLPTDAYYVGDTHYDMEAARAASMTPVGVTWGVAPASRLREYTELVFSDVPSLGKFLKKTLVNQ